MCLYREIANNFSPRGAWGHNGPDAISRSMKRICNVNEVPKMKPEICWGFHVLPKRVLYPIFWQDWKWLFDANLLNETLRITKEAVAVHFWNRLSSSTLILKDFKNKTVVEFYKEKLKKNVNILNPYGETAYGYLAKIHCPSVYNSSGDFF